MFLQTSIRTKQIAQSLKWFHAFCRFSAAVVERDSAVKSDILAEVFIETVLDASPWGPGGFCSPAATVRGHLRRTSLNSTKR